jgi:YgiT-type zinc finger domain-containing protein
MTRKLLCDNCGQLTARKRKITRSYGQGPDLLIIENVPVMNCSHCGETYLTAATLRAIERIKRQPKQLAKERRVAVASL